MKRTVILLGVALAAITLLSLLAAGIIYTLSDRKQLRRIDVHVASAILPVTAASWSRGRDLFGTCGCTVCHGVDGGGYVVIDEPGGLYVRTATITTSGVTAAYEDVDWLRLLRFGVKADGHALLIMPGAPYAQLTDEDVGALATYVRSLPPQPFDPGEIELPFSMRIAYLFGGLKDAAELIEERQFRFAP